ncbi:helix-turn-helix transcriptional regulator [Amycolatopsis albispora]|uniref:Transcriptional regulator n=1 Tax=Amycolatopsis albispora TaxID=1804986 RepID=A0A344L359_9PSEU|nr:transcriptional regulator [Amycolatopsis albispora]AXB42483.1 transcriptional regulator [Amycolatopsis albispora]
MLELLSLLQSGRDWPGAELAERLGTSPRTLRRDLDRLRELGYPVRSARGPGGSYRLVAGRALPPLMFTDDEAVAAVVGLRFAALATGDPGADDALRKLEQALPDRLRHRTEAVSSATQGSARPMAAADPAVVAGLATAAKAHRHADFDYTSRNGVSRRRVEPYRQVLLGRRWYLFAFDRDREDWRTFRLDRIAAVHVPGTTFRPREVPENGMTAFGTARAGGAVVHFDAPVEVVAERLRAEAGSLIAVDDRRCRYVTGTDDWAWLAASVAAVGVAYRVEGPPELVEETRALARRVAEAVSAPAPP